MAQDTDRSRQTDTSRALPPVETVGAGIASVPVPIPGNPLGYVLVYAVETDDGLLLVDAGWDAAESWDALVAGLQTAGADVSDVAGVVVTHIHPDHYGLAGRVREASGAWIGLHPADAALIRDRYADWATLIERNDGWLRETGTPEVEITRLRDASLSVLEKVRAVQPDVAVTDGQRFTAGGRDLVAMHTPGHTPGHVCLVDRAHDLVFTGDHVLPRISPNVSAHPQSDPDPLGDYLGALARVAETGLTHALPAHLHRFDGPGERAEEIARHHDERLDEVVTVVAAGARTTWEVATSLTWSRPFEEIDLFLQRAAVGETLAHLRRLELDGRVVSREGVPTVWEPAATAS